MKNSYFTIFFICLALIIAQSASGANFCASGSVQLQTYLNTAASNSQNDVIKVVQGTYFGSFYMDSSNGDNISIQGGYTSGCSSRTVDPDNTTLNAIGTGSRVLRISNINSTGGDITVEGFTIINGTAAETDYNGKGAGLYLLSYATSGTKSGNIAVTKNIIRDNDAVYQGGGVYAESRSVTSTGSAGTITISYNTIQDNTASGESYASGGGIFAESYSNPDKSSHVSILSNQIIGNSSTYGGGVYAYSYGGGGSGDITVQDNNVQDNTAAGGNGGGIYAGSHSTEEAADSGKVTVRGNTVKGNAASGGNNLGKGGGVYAYSGCANSGNGGDVILKGNTIKENHGRNGGGVYGETTSYSGIGGDLRFESNMMCGNTSGRDGAGLRLLAGTNSNTAGDMIFINNIIAGNRTAENYSGGGMWVRTYGYGAGTAGNYMFTNNTITNNRSSYTGGIEIVGENNTATFYNNIIYGNTGYDIYSYNNPVSFNGYTNNTSFSSWDSGNGNINSTPEFKDPGFWNDNGTSGDPYDDIWLGGDFHLRSNSPCIDTATNSAPDLPGTDFEGDTRQIDGDRDGTPTVDMGADEFLNKAITSILFLLLGIE